MNIVEQQSRLVKSNNYSGGNNVGYVFFIPFKQSNSNVTTVNNGASVVDPSTGLGSGGSAALYTWGGGVPGSGRKEGFQQGKDPLKTWPNSEDKPLKGYKQVGKSTKGFVIKTQ